MTEVAIIGNGPSRDILSNDNKTFDIRVACNFAQCDAQYRVFVDAFAAKFYRPGQKYNDEFGKSRIVLGERAAAGLDRIKARPGSVETMREWFENEGALETIVRYPAQFRDKQHYFSSGHLAFMFAVENLNADTIHMFGFDSVFTGDHKATYSNAEIREHDKPYIQRNQRETPFNGAQQWSHHWHELFKNYSGDYPTTLFYGYEGDENFALEADRVEAVYIRRGK